MKSQSFTSFIHKQFKPYDSPVWFSLEDFFYQTIKHGITLLSQDNVVYKSPENILITGGSSGIGEALAKYYSKKSTTKIITITGRNEERLEKVKNSLQDLNSNIKVYTLSLDVTNREEMKKALIQSDNERPIDMLITNAGIGVGSIPEDNPPIESIYSICNTNIFGMQNTITPMLAPFQKRGKGQIVIISSINGIANLLHHNPYPASKSAALYFGECLRQDLQNSGIGVTVVCPGYVETALLERMVRSKRTPPFMISSERASEIIGSSLQYNPPVISFPLPTTLGGYCLRTIPFAYRHIMCSFFGKQHAKPYVSRILDEDVAQTT